MTESFDWSSHLKIPLLPPGDARDIPRSFLEAGSQMTIAGDELALDISPDSDFSWPEIDIEALAQNAPAQLGTMPGPEPRSNV